MPEWITYEMFGAVGDGVHDDMPAIVRAHEEANRLRLPVKAAPGAVYYIAPRGLTAAVQTSADWTGAKFLIDDVGCRDIGAPVFHVCSALAPLPLQADRMTAGQTALPNPFSRELFVIVENAAHRDYIRKGLNQDHGHPRTDVFVLRENGTLSSPLSFDFDGLTSLAAHPVDPERLTLRGGEFTTIANQAESRYNYHSRNIRVTRSNVTISGLRHYITGEKDHGAPYMGFIHLTDCARVTVEDCLFTAHRIFETIGSAGLPVPMGSYDIRADRTADVLIRRCTQTTDIHDSRYWGLFSSNFCRDMTFEDCVFSRFDAHMGVSNCTLRRCRLGWQCLNAIGSGTFLIEDTQAYGDAFVNLRDDYGCTWRGEIILRNCTWQPRSTRRAVFSGHNDGTHDFGYPCHMPDVTINGLDILEDAADSSPLYIFNNYLGAAPDPATRPHMPRPPRQVRVQGIRTPRPVRLCENPALMPDTAFTQG